MTRADRLNFEIENHNRQIAAMETSLQGVIDIIKCFGNNISYDQLRIHKKRKSFLLNQLREKKSLRRKAEKELQIIRDLSAK